MKLDPVDLAVRLATCRVIIRVLRDETRGDHESTGALCYETAVSKVRTLLNGLENRIDGHSIGEELGNLLLLDRPDAVKEVAGELLPEIFNPKDGVLE